MLAGARGRLGHSRGHARRAALRDHHSVGAGGIGGAKNRTQVVRIFNSIEHHDQRILPALGGDHVIQMVVLLGRSDRDHALVSIVPRHAIEFGAAQKTHRHPIAPALLHHALQAQVVTLFQYANPLERPPARLQRFGNGIDPIDVIHRAVSLLPGEG